MPGATIKLQKFTNARQREFKAIAYKSKYERTRSAYMAEKDPAERERLRQEMIDAKLNWEHWQHLSNLDKLRRSKTR